MLILSILASRKGYYMAMPDYAALAGMDEPSRSCGGAERKIFLTWCRRRHAIFSRRKIVEKLQKIFQKNFEKLHFKKFREKVHKNFTKIKLYLKNFFSIFFVKIFLNIHISEATN